MRHGESSSIQVSGVLVPNVEFGEKEKSWCGLEVSDKKKKEKKRKKRAHV